MTDNHSEQLTAAAETAWRRGFEWLIERQHQRGNWLGETKWNTQLSSQYVIVSYLTGQPIVEARRNRLLRYFETQRTSDGAWGMHNESPPSVFHTTLAYVALRLLGLAPSDNLTHSALAWLKTSGGVLGNPTWGKFWLALVNLYAWKGVHPFPPELWLLPRWLPVHPMRLYNHTRLIYLAMAYLYGRRFSGALSPVIEALRGELYDVSYERLDFAGNRSKVAASDLYAPPGWFLKLGFRMLHHLESLGPHWWRQHALEECFAQIVFEVRASNYVSISPVNGLLNVLALWDRRHPDFLPAYDGLHYWYWEDDVDGMRAGGAHSHTWDTTFTIRAALAAPSALRPVQLTESLRRAHAFLRDSQLANELTEEHSRRRWMRDRNLGGWCFSDERQGWPVSDCTAEALYAVLEVELALPATEHVADQSLVAAVDFILCRQNGDGGFGSFERRRGPEWLELFNASEMFARCMVEGSYVECTASCVVGLARFRQRLPGMREREISRAVKRGVHCLLARQRADGSWEGAWGVNFTYATLFCVEGLLAAGLPVEHPSVRRAGSWLLEHQMPAGGWGEHWISCLTGEYCAHERPQVIMTAWALLALLHIGDLSARTAVDDGIRWLVNSQLPSGDFPEESRAGVFFRTGLLHYGLYKNYFPLWAIGSYLRSTVATENGD